MGKIDSRITTVLIAVVLILLLCWFIGNLGVSFHRMEGKEPAEPQRKADTRPPGRGLTSPLPDYFSSLCLLSILGVVSLFGLLYSNEERMKSMLMRFIVWTVGLILLYGVARSGIVFSDDGGSSSFPDWPFGGGAREQITPGSAGTFISLTIVVALVGVLAALIFYQKMVVRKEKARMPDKDVEEDLSSTLDKAITELYQGKDVRDVIYRCYIQMCLIMERQGVTQEEFITPRELRNKAVAHLPVDEKIVSELTSLFEEARYSTHKLGDDKRKKAVEDLKNFKRELGV